MTEATSVFVAVEAALRLFIIVFFPVLGYMAGERTAHCEILNKTVGMLRHAKEVESTKETVERILLEHNDLLGMLGEIEPRTFWRSFMAVWLPWKK